MTRDIIAIGASAGGIEPLSAVLQRLPAELPATIFVVVHRTAAPGSDALLGTLQRCCRLLVLPALAGAIPQHGRVYVSPADAHMRVVDGRLRTGEELGVHPGRGSINVLFHCVAAEYGSRSIGVVLSGVLDDGTTGLREIHRAGGIAIAQDPSGAAFPSMPAHARAEVPLHYCLHPDQIAETLVGLVTGTLAEADH